MRRDSIGIAIAGLFAAAGAAHAGTVVQFGSLAPTTTNWSTNFQVNPFDTHGGALTLESVVIDLEAMFGVTARAENRDHADRSLTLNMSANISIMLGATSLAAVAPDMSQAFSAQAFDGFIDFGGTSGKTFSDLMQNASAETIFSTPTNDLSAWLGSNPIVLTALAIAHTSVTGGGNLTSQFNSQAAVDYTVTYIYRGEIDPNGAVPLPSAAALGLAGLCGVAGFHRRRR